MTARWNRRSILRGVAGAAGLAATGGLAPSAAAAVNLSPLLFHSPQVRPFRDPLPPLPVWSGSSFTLDAAVGTHRFHSELDPSPAFGYGGRGYLGPVLETHSGTETTVTFRNTLSRHVFAKDIDTTLHGVSAADATAPRGVLHLHGGVTPPAFDGHPEATIRPGEQVTYRFPGGQEATALWYHDHAMGITRLNVYAGLASLYLLRDRWDTGEPGNPLGLPAGEFEIPLVLQEKVFTADGAQSVRTTPLVPEGSWEGGGVGDTGLVNGVVWPEVAVARGLYRLRVLNASSFSVANLFFANRMRFWVIGTDGGLLDAPVATTAIRLAPAERADLLVDFGALAPGETVVLCNDEPVPGQAAILGEVTMPYFCRFRAGSAPGFQGAVPSTLRGGPGQPPRLPPLPVPDHVRDVTISQPFELRFPPSVMTLNNLMFDSGDLELPRQGTVEQWNLIDVTPDPHPIHLHLVNFRVLGRQSFDRTAYRLRYPQPPVGTKWAPSADAFVTGPMRPAEPWEAGWKDTVRTDGGTVTRILVRFPTAGELGFDPDAIFTAPSGAELRGYVWHCHLLDHEDHDMMLRFRTPA
ncbi:multicopper oxidase domain-containing protein [Amycolatopsis cynarae]|uniref:Multicopper oxidase domain-containing protein n=1 Tax=Amycolatopsis cynarae TaxID=2995223 RepID=A0ABY7BBF7_9PSEU|nr:multicopper oxidase domain-containing protein [Amycolatopsis sp. HUAS 11-8]WAL68754.1 multicopper oxidase domain-containing protein [Amycolatopsis sp. HUAS 11-8]